MNVTERREIYYFAMSPDAPQSANCKHFHLHYVPDGIRGYRPANSGHCIYPRLKLRRVFDTCRYFNGRKEEAHEQNRES